MTSEVYIQATETDPLVQAQAAVREIHRRLRDRLGEEDGPAAARRQLAAADEALYAPAAGAADTRLLVRGLRAGARVLDAQARDVSTPEGAQALDAGLAVHFAVECEVLLPALDALPGVDLLALVGDFGTLLDGGELERPDTIDVREIPHGQRHPTIFGRYARLAPGESFLLVNNHDPKPLRREFEATHPGAFSWDYEESGPEQWQVRIGRVAAE